MASLITENQCRYELSEPRSISFRECQCAQAATHDCHRIFAEDEPGPLFAPLTNAHLHEKKPPHRIAAHHLVATAFMCDCDGGPPSSICHTAPLHASPVALARIEPPGPAQEPGWDSDSQAAAAVADPFHADWPHW